METSSPTESRTQHALHEADTYVRENPIPAVLTAIGVGFALGLVIRSLNRPAPRDLFDDRLDEARGILNSILSPVAKESTKAYRRSAKAVRQAVDTAKDIDVEDYTDPVVSWFSRIWKSCCG